MKKKIKKRNIFGTMFIAFGLIAVFPRPQNFSGTNPLRVANGDLPLLIAHGGGNQEFPDNTLEAYYHAYSINPNVMLETDVNLTKDGVVILSHDRTLDQKTNLINADIIETNYADLVANDVDFGFDNDISGANGYNVSGVFKPYQNYLGEEVSPLDVTYPEGIEPRHPTKFLVSTLEELITLFPNNLINVEIKQTGETGLLALNAVVKLMDELDETYQTYERIVLASFHQEVFAELTNLQETSHPQLMFSPEFNGVLSFFIMQTTLTSVFYRQPVAVFQLPTEQLGLSLSTELLIRTAHLHNIAVHYWTINDEATMRLLIEKGVDGIMTDRPTLLQQVLDSYQ
ncbi:MAG: glycerophosphodiester phosphodiesterase family protein [Bacilli bacterium]